MYPPTPSQHEMNVLRCKVEATNATNVGNTSNLSKANALKDVQPPVEPQSNKDAEDSVSTHADVYVGPAWHIPMTQVDLDWQDSVSPTPSSSLNAAPNVAKDLDVVGKSQIAEAHMVVAVDTLLRYPKLKRRPSWMPLTRQPPKLLGYKSGIARLQVGYMLHRNENILVAKSCFYDFHVHPRMNFDICNVYNKCNMRLECICLWKYRGPE